MKYYISESDAKGTIAVDDMILTKNTPTTAGSRMLENFNSLFAAEAVERLEKKGYSISGKTAVGEFGLDLVGEFSYFADFSDSDKLFGAAASLVADKKVAAALGVDLNGAPRRSAALSGVCFLKPTYGTVSRYGVVACACSGEQIGVYAPTAAKTAEIMTVIAGHDDKDGTSLPHASYEYDYDMEVSGTKVCIIKELFDAADDDAKAKVTAYAETLKAQGVSIETVSLELVFAARSAWQILMAAETCNNLSRYDGVKFGYRTPNYENIDELYVNTRTEAFNLLTKETILYGSHVLSKSKYTACYDKALRLRRIVAEQIKELFASYDAVLTPAMRQTAYAPYPIEEAFSRVYNESLFTAIPNLIGIPALVSGGVQLMASQFDEGLLLSLAKSAEGKGV